MACSLFCLWFWLGVVCSVGLAFHCSGLHLHVFVYGVGMFVHGFVYGFGLVVSRLSIVSAWAFLGLVDSYGLLFHGFADGVGLFFHGCRRQNHEKSKAKP